MRNCHSFVTFSKRQCFPFTPGEYIHVLTCILTGTAVIQEQVPRATQGQENCECRLYNNYRCPSLWVFFFMVAAVVLQLAGVAATAAAGAVGVGVALQAAVFAGELELHPAELPWSHNGLFQALDHARYNFY